MRPKTYHGNLPRPDHLGRWRPVVGQYSDGKPTRFQVGNKKVTSEAEAIKRLDTASALS